MITNLNILYVLKNIDKLAAGLRPAARLLTVPMSSEPKSSEPMQYFFLYNFCLFLLINYGLAKHDPNNLGQHGAIHVLISQVVWEKKRFKQTYGQGLHIFLTAFKK